MQIVSFYVQNQEFAIDVMSVREIISMTQITRTANSCGSLEGVINLRGNIIPIFSLRKCLNMPESVDDSANCIAIMDFAGELKGFIIDEISDVLHIRRTDILPSPDTVEQPWIEGVIVMDQRIVVVMNLAQLHL